ncbi:hypothetical protein PVAG01_10257 [Phlyctema vagabunda]|uniref:F-box domain-containing protein n=1 Tax=Phlyctema vagabunda TaxID=108571 RepID=A0ABR4P5I6_9HELO
MSLPQATSEFAQWARVGRGTVPKDSLERLPNEILANIFNRMGLGTRHLLGRTSRHMHAVYLEEERRRPPNDRIPRRIPLNTREWHDGSTWTLKQCLPRDSYRNNMTWDPFQQRFTSRDELKESIYCIRYEESERTEQRRKDDWEISRVIPDEAEPGDTEDLWSKELKRARFVYLDYKRFYFSTHDQRKSMDNAEDMKWFVKHFRRKFPHHARTMGIREPLDMEKLMAPYPYGPEDFENSVYVSEDEDSKDEKSDDNGTHEMPVRLDRALGLRRGGPVYEIWKGSIYDCKADVIVVCVDEWMENDVHRTGADQGLWHEKAGNDVVHNWNQGRNQYVSYRGRYCTLVSSTVARYTTSGNMPSDWTIMIRVAEYDTSRSAETNEYRLRRSYAQCLRKAMRMSPQLLIPTKEFDEISWRTFTIAFDLMGSGPLGFHPRQAAIHALLAITDWCNGNMYEEAINKIQTVKLFAPKNDRNREVEQAWREAMYIYCKLKTPVFIPQPDPITASQLAAIIKCNKENKRLPRQFRKPKQLPIPAPNTATRRAGQDTIKDA